MRLTRAGRGPIGSGSEVGGAKAAQIWPGLWDNQAQETLVHTGADPDVRAGPGPGPAHSAQQSGLFQIFGPNLWSFWILIFTMWALWFHPVVKVGGDRRTGSASPLSWA